MSETPKEVWILLGETGEYSDHSEWIVCAYANEADADADCAALNERAKGLEGISHSARDEAIAERLRPHDAYAQAAYTGLMYSVIVAEVRAAPHVPSARPPAKADPRDEASHD